MYNLADNSSGMVYILDGFDPATKSFAKVTAISKPCAIQIALLSTKMRNGVDWFYLALTDRLVRYKYIAGEDTPSSKPEMLATFPDYGLSYKYGGWHLTRTVAIGVNGKIYVSVGSSCNACEEKEEVRASILEMDADGKNQKRFAHGLRNAVGPALDQNRRWMAIWETAICLRPTWVRTTWAITNPRTRCIWSTPAQTTVGPTATSQALPACPIQSSIAAERN